MNHDFSCCSLDGVQKGVKIKVCPKYRYQKMACSMVYSKSLLTNVYKTRFIAPSRNVVCGEMNSVIAYSLPLL